VKVFVYEQPAKDMERYRDMKKDRGIGKKEAFLVV
jgi:hypothetical protein